MFVVTPLVSGSASLARCNPHGSGRIIWQQQYEGIAHVAYRDGKAIAGVSGPWSDRYVLIWWNERPAQSNPLELFETVEAAMRAVEACDGQALAEIKAANEAHFPAPRSWWRRLWPRSRQHRATPSRRDSGFDDIDLTGLNFSALS
ncbi:MAG: hypothetical protein JSS28_01060 [Proteobacteria bacterium]|nr:hypothetical protein [Pseudomonadota bacterium]